MPGRFSNDVAWITCFAKDIQGWLGLKSSCKRQGEGKKPRSRRSPVRDHHHNRRPLTSARRSPIRTGFFKTAP
jgi:hypothetical protein